MKKQILKSALIALAGVGLMSGSGWAISNPQNLKDITGITGTEVYKDGGWEYGILNHTGNSNTDSTAFLFFEIAGNAISNSFGIYGFTDIGGVVTKGEMLELFNGVASPLTSTTVKFDLIAGTATNQATNVTKNIGTTFGWYLSNPDEGTFYSHTYLNGGQLDYFMTFNTSDNSIGALLGSDVVLGIEDLYGLGDKDYDDMVIGMTDVNVVPEPTTMLLFGTGLLGLASVARRKKN